MPRGMDPNSRKNLKRGVRISEGTAREYAEKSAKSRRANGVLRAAFMESITSDSAAKIADAHRRKAEHGNEGSTRLIMELLGEDQKRQLEIERLRAEIDRLKAEVAQDEDDTGYIDALRTLSGQVWDGEADEEDTDEGSPV